MKLIKLLRSENAALLQQSQDVEKILLSQNLQNSSDCSPQDELKQRQQLAQRHKQQQTAQQQSHNLHKPRARAVSQTPSSSSIKTHRHMPY